MENHYDDMPTDEEIQRYQEAGHTFHCAMRILTGDGECECNLKGHIPGEVSRSMYQGLCVICLERHPEHKSFCPFNNEHHMLK